MMNMGIGFGTGMGFGMGMGLNLGLGGFFVPPNVPGNTVTGSSLNGVAYGQPVFNSNSSFGGPDLGT